MTDVQKINGFSDGRPETGPMQFGDDWPGVFIRGDNAVYYRMVVSAAMAALPPDRSAQFAALKALADTLGSCDVRMRAENTER